MRVDCVAEMKEPMKPPFGLLLYALLVPSRLTNLADSGTAQCGSGTVWVKELAQDDDILAHF